jgi:hypothetical protein
MSNSKVDRIRALNDQFRTHPCDGHGRIVATVGVSQLGSKFMARAIQAIAVSDDFGRDNDPHKEHDFGTLVIDGVSMFWKIDYYDLEQRYHSEDAADDAKTVRIMTILLQEEY